MKDQTEEPLGIDGVDLTEAEMREVDQTVRSEGWKILERVFKEEMDRNTDDAMQSDTEHDQWQRTIGCVMVLKNLLDIPRVVDVQLEEMSKK